MEYRNLGNAGVKVSRLCLGTMMFGGATNEQDSIEIIHRAMDGGEVPLLLGWEPRWIKRRELGR
jgi:predicted aldo/keto reductase-like oxidoreductase